MEIVKEEIYEEMKIDFLLSADRLDTAEPKRPFIYKDGMNLAQVLAIVSDSVFLPAVYLF